MKASESPRRAARRSASADSGAGSHHDRLKRGFRHASLALSHDVSFAECSELPTLYLDTRRVRPVRSESRRSHPPRTVLRTIRASRANRRRLAIGRPPEPEAGRGQHPPPTSGQPRSTRGDLGREATGDRGRTRLAPGMEREGPDGGLRWSVHRRPARQGRATGPAVVSCRACSGGRVRCRVAAGCPSSPAMMRSSCPNTASVMSDALPEPSVKWRRATIRSAMRLPVRPLLLALGFARVAPHPTEMPASEAQSAIIAKTHKTLRTAFLRGRPRILAVRPASWRGPSAARQRTPHPPRLQRPGPDPVAGLAADCDPPGCCRGVGNGAQDGPAIGPSHDRWS